jgi:hypothetical protein
MIGYEHIKQIAKESGLNVPDLLAMPCNNDPFYCGSNSQRIQAEWFASLWKEFGYTTGVHLRRVHYQLISQHSPQLYNGKPYENTDACWKPLLNAGKFARYLGLVKPEAFVDRRNPAPQIFIEEPKEDRSPDAWIVEDVEPWRLPHIPTDLAWRINFELPKANVYGYDYSPGDQPYHLEVWVEKSTMDDVLIPVCQELGMNLVTGAGFLSITSIINLLSRTASRNKPVRIFYISDFDPAGDCMSPAAARQIEFWLPKYAPEIEVKVQHLLLTHGQVQKYNLPRIPAKDSDGRKNSFEERYGEGAVELDALEALYPGELANIVREAVNPYLDPGLSNRLREAEQEALEVAGELWGDDTGPYRNDLAHIEEQAKTIVRKYRDQLEHLNELLQKDLAPLKGRLKSIWQDIQNLANNFKPILPERPAPETGNHDESDWLFDSNRDYLDQLTSYKSRK